MAIRTHRTTRWGIFYTCDSDDAGRALGTAGIILDLQKISLWRFGDGPTEAVAFDGVRRVEIGPELP